MAIFILKTVLSILQAICVLSTQIPQQIHFAGFFAPLNSSGFRDVKQLEHLAVFLMAVNEINNKTDGVLDDILPSTQITYSIHGDNLLVPATRSFFDLIDDMLANSERGGIGPLALINALHDENSLELTLLSTKLEIPSCVTRATSGQFNDFGLYPYAVKPAVLQSQDAMAIEAFICSVAKKVVVFASTDVEDIQTMNAFSIYGSCELEVLARVVFRSDMLNFGYEIGLAKATGARYFIVFTSPPQLAALLEQGHVAGLFGPHTVVSVSNRGANGVMGYFSVETDVTKVMTGVLQFKYWPDYYMNRTVEARDFAHRWRRQHSTMGSVMNGQMVCGSVVDADGQEFVFKHTTANHTACTGLDFSSYDLSGLTMQPYTPVTYDGTVLMAKAFDFAFRHELDYSDARVIENLMVENITFAGAGGPMKLFPGFKQYNNSNRATRSQGIMFKVLSFIPTLYESGSLGYMGYIGHVDTDAREFISCGEPDMLVCFAPVFSSGSGYSYEMPSDAPPPIIEYLPVISSALMFALGTFTLLLVLLLGWFVIAHRSGKVIKASQPVLLFCILFGGVISSVRIISGGLDKTTDVCLLEIWAGHLGFMFMIGSLFVKAYRVHVIVNTNLLKKVIFTAWDAVKCLVGILFVTCIYLFVLTIEGQPQVSFSVSSHANQMYYLKTCEMKTPQYQTALFAIEFIILISAFRICWEIRNVPDIVNESKQISTAMTSILMVCILIMPIVFLLGLHPYTRELIASFGFGFGAIATLVLLFLPKLILVYKKVSSAKISAMDSLSSNNKQSMDSKNTISATPTCRDRKIENGNMLTEKSREERLLICQEQLKYWQTQLLQEQALAIEGGGSGEEIAPNTVLASRNLEKKKEGSHANPHGAALYAVASLDHMFQSTSWNIGFDNNKSIVSEVGKDLQIQDI